MTELTIPADAGGTPKPELPVERATRIAKELSAALNEVEGYHMAIVYPSAAHQYPVLICLEETYAQQMKALYAYRTARNLLGTLKPRTKAYRDALDNLSAAKTALDDSFNERAA